MASRCCCSGSNSSRAILSESHVPAVICTDRTGTGGCTPWPSTAGDTRNHEAADFACKMGATELCTITAFTEPRADGTRRKRIRRVARNSSNTN